MDQEDRPIVRWNYDVTQVLELRNLLTELLVHQFAGKLIDGKRFDEFVDVVVDKLPGDLDYETVRRSCVQVAGTSQTKESLRQFSHLMAGNLPRLKRRRHVSAWAVQKLIEWVPVQIVAVKRHRYDRAGLGGNFRFFVLAGTSAGLSVRRWWSFRYCSYISTDLGFSKPSFGSKRVCKYPFTALEQFVTLRLNCLMSPEESQEDSPGFRSIEVRPSMLAWNKQQIKHRARIDEGYGCPQGRPQSLECHNCPAGYLSCRAGTHAKDYVQGHCQVCGNEDAMFDPDWAGNACVDCQRAEHGPKKKKE